MATALAATGQRQTGQDLKFGIGDGYLQPGRRFRFRFRSPESRVSFDSLRSFGSSCHVLLLETDAQAVLPLQLEVPQDRATKHRAGAAVGLAPAAGKCELPATPGSSWFLYDRCLEQSKFWRITEAVLVLGRGRLLKSSAFCSMNLLGALRSELFNSGISKFMAYQGPEFLTP